MGALNPRIWQCPECDRSVNGFVNGRRCPSCREDVFDGRECADRFASSPQ